MEREKIERFMLQIGIQPNQSECTWYEMIDGIPLQLSRLIRLVEQETLERAAKVCIDKAMKMENEASLADTEDDAISLRSSAWLISVCGNEIRNLKDNHDKE